MFTSSEYFTIIPLINHRLRRCAQLKTGIISVLGKDLNLIIKSCKLFHAPFGNHKAILNSSQSLVWNYELPDISFKKIPYKIFENNNMFASCASGSSGYDTMIICPCSMGTLGRIASGVSDNLISRTADVMLKERKKLIMVSREMPLNLIHINNMKTITEAGAIICPASPSFYSLPKNMEELVLTVINKVLLLAGFEIESFHWGKKI